MKIDRLISILSVLLQKDKVTASYLSQKFEVSKRTILRDIENLNNAGIPIVTSQGSGGGISIMENYKLDKTLLSEKELQAVITGLKGLDSVSDSKKYQHLMNKLSVEKTEALTVDNNIIIDLSMWDKAHIADKIDVINYAAENNLLLSFKYFSPTGESIREIEPYRLVFQWSSWYVWGYCKSRNDYRMFKLNRMTNIKCINIKFKKRDIPEYKCDKLRHTRGNEEIIVRFDKSVKWRLIDEWGSNKFEEDENGNLVIKFTWADKEALLNWLLTFGDKGEILLPKNIREEFIERVKSILNKYDI